MSRIYEIQPNEDLQVTFEKLLKKPAQKIKQKRVGRNHFRA